MKRNGKDHTVDFIFYMLGVSLGLLVYFLQTH